MKTVTNVLLNNLDYEDPMFAVHLESLLDECVVRDDIAYLDAVGTLHVTACSDSWVSFDLSGMEDRKITVWNRRERFFEENLGPRWREVELDDQLMERLMMVRSHVEARGLLISRGGDELDKARDAVSKGEAEEKWVVFHTRAWRGSGIRPITIAAHITPANLVWEGVGNEDAICTDFYTMGGQIRGLSVNDDQNDW